MTDCGGTAFTKSIQGLTCTGQFEFLLIPFPGYTISPPASDGRTRCKGVFLMSSEIKFSIISGQWSQKRKRSRIRATTRESLHLQLSFPTTGMKIVGCTERCLFHRQQLFVCSLCLMHTCQTKLDVWWPFSHTCCMNFRHCCFFPLKVKETRIHCNINEKCQGCLKRALWAYFIAKSEKEKILKKEAYLFCYFVHCVLEVIVNIAVSVPLGTKRSVTSRLCCTKCNK